MSGEKLPILRATELIRVLERMGFARLRKSKSSHIRYGHSDGRKVTVPVHKGKTIGRGLLRKILRDLGRTVKELGEFM